jgi:hypothetical protein
MINYLGYQNIVPLLAAQDIASTVTVTNYLDLKTAHRAALLIVLGAVTSATATDAEVLTIEAATAEGGSEAAIAFSYRLSGALGTNTWGAITASASTGLSLDPAVHDNMCIWVEIDPAVMAANDYRYVRAKFTDTPDMTAFLVAVVGVIDPRYKMTTYISATASASA